MRKILLFAVAILTGTFANANPIDQTRAKSIASDFFAHKGVQVSNIKESFKSPRKTATTQNDAYYYIFNADNNKGFVIVSGDDRTDEILGYSDNGSIDMNNMPENMRSWLQFYADQIKYLDDHNIQTSQKMSAHAPRMASKAHHSIAPILTCNWNQGDPYNLQCPEYYNEDGSIGGRSATGCVATAIAQVLYHHKYPAVTKGRIPSHQCKWNLNDGTSKTYTMKAITAGTPIDWDNMVDNYHGGETQEQKDAVAFLMKLVGQSVKMGYGASSGSSYAESRKLFVDYLGYDDGVQILRSDNFGIQEWFEMMYDELALGFPIAYGGSSTGGGHAFVVDGFDGEDLFHLNWGWGGGSNGYFRISVLNPGDNSGIGASSSADGYSMGQDAIMYLRGYDDGVDAGYEPDTHMSINDTRIDGTKIFSNYINWTGSTNSFNGAIVMENEEGVLTPVSNINNADNLGANYLYGWTFDMQGRFSAPGSYKITPASKLKSAKRWRPLYNLRDEYILAEVDNNLKVTLTMVQPVYDLEVTGWNFPGSRKAGDQQDVNITIKNNGQEFKREVALYASKTDDMGKSVSRALIGVKSGATEEFTFFFQPTETGTYNIWLTMNNDRNKVIGKTTVNITNTAQNNARLKVSSVSVSNNGYGDFLAGTMTVQNLGSKDFAGFVNVQFWSAKANEGTYWSGSSQRLYYEIPAGNTATASFRFDNLEIGRKYRFAQSYVGQSGELEEGGLFAGGEWLLNKGAVTITKNGTMSGAAISAATTYKALSSGASVRFYGVTPKAITPSSNPNFVYAFENNATMPTGIEGLNVVVGDKAQTLTLSNDHVVYFPSSFTAENASFTFTTENTTTGQGNWVPVTMPFAPTKVTIDGNETTWTHNGKEGAFWIKEFIEVDEANDVVFDDATELRRGTPYLIGIPEELAGKNIVFSAQNASITASNTDNMLVGSAEFNFYGNYLESRKANTYTINEEGTAFTFNSSNTAMTVFQPYFTTKLAEAPEQINIKLAHDSTVNGIKDVTMSNKAEKAVFDLQGRRVENPSKGIYIINGKKTIVR